MVRYDVARIKSSADNGAEGRSELGEIHGSRLRTSKNLEQLADRN